MKKRPEVKKETKERRVNIKTVVTSDCSETKGGI